MGNDTPPIIIWTTQRTGGTNLARHLLALSPYKVKHEPFNKPREFGHITTDWIKRQDIVATEAEIEATLSDPINIKHCVEMVPKEINACLAKHAVRHDYLNLFLVRENALQRLLSMEYAQRTKVWGPNHEKPDEDNDPAFEASLDIEKLVEHEKKCVMRLNKLWNFLHTAGARVHALSFEQVYESSFEAAVAQVSATISFLGYNLQRTRAEDRIRGLRETGNQDTRDRYQKFEGIGTLDTALKTVPDFAFLR
ncbi:hypothetical protein [Tropicimonas sp.]|uniref:hypothetical protein n=1 Tax=Tropicimonas sp. TaxID=2067044 RepID=UPI003A8911D8